MAVDPTQLLQDAACIEACIPPGMIPAATLGQMVQPSVVVTSIVAQTVAASLLLAANTRRRRAIIQNLSAGNAFFVGPSNVTSSTGFQIFSTGSPALSRLEVFTQGELYQVAGTAGQNISVMEFLTPA